MPKITDSRIAAKNLGRNLRNVAVGYTRVSTPDQGANGISLDVQQVAIEKFADDMDYRLIEVFKEVGSAVGAKSFHNRKILQRALDLVVREGAVLIVWDWCRLSRYAGFENQLRKILPDLGRVICARVGNTMREAARDAQLKHHETSATIIARRTREGMGKKRAEGVIFGNPDIRTKVQPFGASSWSAMCRDHDHLVANALRSHPDPMNLSRAQAAEFLNQCGLRTLHNNEWTTSRVTEPLRRARAILREEEKMQTASDPRFGMF